MPKKSTVLLTMTACAMIVVSGCGQAKQAPDKRNAATDPSPSPTISASANPGASPTPAPTLSQQEKQITVYFGNPDASALVEKTVKISYTTPSSKYLNALNSMKKSDDANSVALFTALTFKTAELKAGNLVVDLSVKDTEQLGSSGEDLLMQAIKKTLFQFDEVKTIDLQVDGKKTDSLMGHIDLPHPIQRP